MKAIILICILFTSLLILSPAIATRELAESGSGGQAVHPKIPNKPIICGNDPNNPAPYSKCIGKVKPKPKCSKYNVRGCEP